MSIRISNTEWTFIRWKLLYLFQRVLSSKIAAMFVLFTLVMSFLLHDSDLARIGKGLVHLEVPFLVGYVFLALMFFLTIMDPLLRKTSIEDFETSLPFSMQTRYFSKIVTMILVQIPVLNFGFMCLLYHFKMGLMALCGLVVLSLVNLCLLYCAEYVYGATFTRLRGSSLSRKVLAFSDLSNEVYLVVLNSILFLRANRSNYMRDVFVAVLILLAFLTLSWGKDPNAVDFMFFVFGCLLASSSRYLRLFKDFEDEHTEFYWRSLPFKRSSKSWIQSCSTFVLMFPFWALYVCLTHAGIRSFLLCLMSVVFVLVRKFVAKRSGYICFGLSMSVYLAIRGSL